MGWPAVDWSWRSVNSVAEVVTPAGGPAIWVAWASLTTW
jgi:hypothetical protein